MPSPRLAVAWLTLLLGACGTRPAPPAATKSSAVPSSPTASATPDAPAAEPAPAEETDETRRRVDRVLRGSFTGPGKRQKLVWTTTHYGGELADASSVELHEASGHGEWTKLFEVGGEAFRSCERLPSEGFDRLRCEEEESHHVWDLRPHGGRVTIAADASAPPLVAAPSSACWSPFSPHAGREMETQPGCRCEPQTPGLCVSDADGFVNAVFCERAYDPNTKERSGPHVWITVMDGPCGM